MICKVVDHYQWKALPLDFQAAFQPVIRHAFWPDYQPVIGSVILAISAGNEKERSDASSSYYLVFREGKSTIHPRNLWVWNSNFTRGSQPA